MDIGGTEITRLNSQTHFIVREVLNVTGRFISDGGVDNFGNNFMISVSGIGDGGIFHDQSRLRSIGGGFNLSSEMLIKSRSFRSNGKQTDSISSSRGRFHGRFNMGFSKGLNFSFSSLGIEFFGNSFMMQSMGNFTKSHSGSAMVSFGFNNGLSQYNEQ